MEAVVMDEAGNKDIVESLCEEKLYSLNPL